MGISNKSGEKIVESMVDPGLAKPTRNTACEAQVEKDTLPEVSTPPVSDAAPVQMSSANPISDELNRLYEACWKVLREPLHAAMTFRLALCAMETVCRLEPGNGAYLLALAIAHYRLGKYQDALTTLEQVDPLIAGTPTSLAFQTMAHHQRGAVAEAATLFSRLQQMMQQPPWHQDAESDGFLREARAVIAGPAETGK
jgi:tetratricopeptide (TPR) repeat protein